MGLDAIRGHQESFPPFLEENLSLHGVESVVGGHVWLKSDPSILLLDGPEVGPRDCSGRGRFCSLHLPAIRVSAVMKWFILCIISGTMLGGFFTNDQNNLDGCIPIRNAWITKEECASRIACVSVANRLTNWASDSSLPWAMPRNKAAMGFDQALARKFCSSSFAIWSKEKMDAWPSRLYHIQAGPLKVVEKTRHMSTSDESYNAILAWKATTCSDGSKLSSYDSKAGNLKLVRISLSCISGSKGDPYLELSPSSSFDLVTSFFTSSSHLFMRRSYARSESVEFDDNVSGSCRVWSTLRHRVVDFFGTIEGVSNQGSGGSCFVEPGWIGAACSESPLGRPEATRAPAEVEPPSERTEECGG
ncbi:hypothetical protein BHM03_00012737 [Ensete ventricosum]|nr:hypothetical protein BHM03_00012737 [Ensete ventricosum]